MHKENTNTKCPDISLIVPYFNESPQNIEKMNIFKEYFDSSNYTYEILVINDGSIKNSDKLKKQTKKINAKYIEIIQNKGKGNAIKTGIEKSNGQYIFFADADHSTPIEYIEDLIKYKNDYSVIIGSRYMSGSKIIIPQPFFRKCVSWFARLIIRNLLLQRKIYDSQCGFKLIESKVAKEIASLQTIYRWGFDAEILLIALEKGYRIKEVPISWYHEKISQVKGIPASYSTFKEVIKIKKNQLKGLYK